MSNALKPRAAVERMAPYTPPTGGRAGKLRLDFNENTVGCSPRVIAYLKEKLTADALTVYPEYVDAMRELAAFFAVAPGELLLSNGTDEAIQVLINTFVDDGADVLLLKPSYAMYRFYVELAGANVREIEYRPGDLAFPLEEFLAAIRPDTRAILIANPD
jgi:histidinol-phosphate aminotransferase